MTCETVRLPGGGVAMVCGPRARPPGSSPGAKGPRKCYVPGCPTPAAFQCDFPTGRGTCDRHVCAAHRSAQGTGVDFCPEHARQPALPLEERRG
jgi:hypothetical protein